MCIEHPNLGVKCLCGWWITVWMPSLSVWHRKFRIATTQDGLCVDQTLVDAIQNMSKSSNLVILGSIFCNSSFKLHRVLFILMWQNDIKRSFCVHASRAFYSPCIWSVTQGNISCKIRVQQRKKPCKTRLYCSQV